MPFIVDTIIRRQMDSINGIRAMARRGEPAFVKFVEDEIDVQMEGDVDYVRRNRQVIESML